MEPHRLAELRSLAYHREIAEVLGADPGRVAEAQARVAGWAESQSVHPHYIERWSHILNLPTDLLRAALVEDSEAARALRQVSPFAGFLSPAERWRIWRAIGEQARAPEAT